MLKMQPSNQFPVLHSMLGWRLPTAVWTPQHQVRSLKPQLTSWSSAWMRNAKNIGSRQWNLLTSHIPAEKLGTLSTASLVEPHRNQTSVPWVPTQLHHFSRQVGKEVAELWKVVYSKDVNMLIRFTTEELVEALKSMKAGKAPGPDDIHPEFLLHAGEAVTKWLCHIMSTCLERCKILKIWRKATVIALPKRNNPKDDPKNYRLISLLCIPFKLLERMIHGPINPIIDPQLPHEQAGFCKSWLTVDQVTLLTAGTVLVDLTAAYDTMWHRGLTLKLLWMLPDIHMVHSIVKLISNRSFVLKTSDGQQSRLRRLKNGVP